MDEQSDIRAVVQAVIEEYQRAALTEERQKRESLEARVNELIAENERSRAAAEEAERSAAIRGELQRLGVGKVELAYRAVKDDIQRDESGRLMSRDGSGIGEYLARFVSENPELLPARLAGGSGTSGASRVPGGSAVDMEKIRPGMTAEEMERVRQEIVRVASQTLRGV
jgi:hypothetical protein